MQVSKITVFLWITTESVIIRGLPIPIDPPVFFCFVKASEPNSILLGGMIRDASKRPKVFNSHDEAVTYVKQFLKSE